MNITKQSILLFDMDGTVVNTNLSNFLAYQKAIKEITNNDISHLQHIFITNRFNKKMLSQFILTSEFEYQKIIELKQKYFHLFIDKTHIIKNTLNIIENYQQNKKYMVTNSDKNRALEIIKFHQLDRYFLDYFFNRLGNKYENSIKQLKLNKQFVICFDDEDIEIEKTNNLNIKCAKIA